MKKVTKKPVKKKGTVKPKAKKVMRAATESPAPPLAVTEEPRIPAPITEWRKVYGRDTWHFVPTCSNWPVENFKTRTEHPTNGELCNECKAKHEQGEG